MSDIFCLVTKLLIIFVSVIYNHVSHPVRGSLEVSSHFLKPFVPCKMYSTRVVVFILVEIIQVVLGGRLFYLFQL